MATLDAIKERIREIAERPRNVRFSEIKWVMDQLSGHGFTTSSRSNEHQTLFSIRWKRSQSGPTESSLFGICHHNPGGSQIKSCYVKQFLGSMIDIGMYDE
jgi:hypothetical protein